jgi:hypothetical protein
MRDNVRPPSRDPLPTHITDQFARLLARRRWLFTLFWLLPDADGAICPPGTFVTWQEPAVSRAGSWRGTILWGWLRLRLTFQRVLFGLPAPRPFRQRARLDE